ncbi:hypothetical protein TSUD_54580 [Trifolium subterraneum]|uniref:Reverse transcriptase zinc-binding domain-containing protein n=1 Tax=Trifolium subterraneum TaxID=3900 RepID=A0A2Z6N1G9_TRISU|nr:hypothetical protein TSUD_54580 [Trifolium subterraneum]
MTKMGFSDVWIQWVMMCVSSVNYTVLMNSDRVGPISPGRGLQQGDQLSPYLFILVTECLTALIHQAVGRGDLHSVRICRGAPEVRKSTYLNQKFLLVGICLRQLKKISFSYPWCQTCIRWRIGSGDNIRVMHDPWLRGSANRWVPSPQPAGVYQLSVRDLLHGNYKAWNIAKVRNLFSKDVVEKILETPLVSSAREDKVVWEEERNECYSVKSGYKLAMCYIIDTRSPLGRSLGLYFLSPHGIEMVLGKPELYGFGDSKIRPRPAPLPCLIWKAQAPHKARHLIWRLCRGCLPTRSRLLERRVKCTLNCPVCDEEIEDELHIFFRCAVARDSWSAAGLSSVLHNATYQQTNAMYRIFVVCSNESSDTVGRVAMLL